MHIFKKLTVTWKPGNMLQRCYYNQGCQFDHIVAFVGCTCDVSVSLIVCFAILCFL